MTDISRPLPGFGDFGGRAWLNTAHQGALPLAAAAAAREAVDWKTAPFELTQARFDGVPLRLREALGRLVNVPAEDIILGNSASRGLHLIANALDWNAGDEVLVLDGDFPSDVLPWRIPERDRGVKVIPIAPRDRVVAPDELEAAITPRTRLFCTTWVHSFSGCAIDLNALGEICRERGVIFVVNGSQGLGARPLDLSAAPVDVFTSVGFKWLCGPYGTGFAWIRPELRDTLRPLQAYWLSMLTAEDLGSGIPRTELREGRGARAFDLFGTANFFNFCPWTVAIEHVLDLGVEAIAAHDQALIDCFIDGLDPNHYEIASPRQAGPRRSTLVFFSHREASRNRAVHEALTVAGVHVAFRTGSLRLAGHLYNSSADIDRALAVLAEQS
ncbi:MAG: aminotransferase class V-fold PLP-dependent enzyme [Alphaproteobacteria bacterium]|nr:aminotransferase class V-fold PLP-dependent enzyme [Alphaproteobacteria bacterium]